MNAILKQLSEGIDLCLVEVQLAKNLAESAQTHDRRRVLLDSLNDRLARLSEIVHDCIVDEPSRQSKSEGRGGSDASAPDTLMDSTKSIPMATPAVQRKSK